ncbi:hypothetical protein SLA2020_312380 [Shorea laevis]
MGSRHFLGDCNLSHAGTSSKITNSSFALESSLLTVKERIKNLENISIVSLVKEQNDGNPVVLLSQPNLEGFPSVQQQRDSTNGGVGFDVIMG